MTRAKVSPTIELEYETFGDPKNPALVLMEGHGAQMVKWDTEYCKMFAANNLFVIRFDNRDCGLSTKFDGIEVDLGATLKAALLEEPVPPVPYTLSDMATDVFTESTSEIQRWVAEQLQLFLKLDHPGSVDGRTFASWMRTNPADQQGPDGVEVLTFHSAKGREWDCVVVAGAEVGLLPHISAISKEQQEEEVRLAYVALTRASHQLFITWSETRKGRTTGRSSLVAEISDFAPAIDQHQVLKRTSRVGQKTRVVSLEYQLKKWRSDRARMIRQLPSVVLADHELKLIAQQKPANTEDLGKIIGQITAKQIGPDLLSIVAKAGVTV